jgi:HEPN domain-containing protein
VSTPANHLDQARRNRDLAERLLALSTDPTNVQWAVVAAFYCAVHCMQAHLIGLGYDPKSHAERKKLIDLQSSGVPEDVRQSYRWLKHRSESARYRLGQFAPQFVRVVVLDMHLERITRFAQL